MKAALNSLLIPSGFWVNWPGNLVALFNIPDTLLNKGFEEITETLITDTLLTTDKFSGGKQRDFLELFADKEFRNQVKQMIYSGTQPSKNFALNYHFEKSSENELRFTKTLELLISYLCVKELKAFSASFGVKIKGAPNGGDFDCIANFQNQLVYFEIKSGKHENIKLETLQNFVDRHKFLSPHFSVLFIDYEGGKDKLNEFAAQFKKVKLGKNQVSLIRKVFNGSQKFYVVGPDIIVVDIHKGDILANLRMAVQYIHRYNAYSKNMSHVYISPSFLGYEFDSL